MISESDPSYTSNKATTTVLTFFESFLKQNLPPKHEILSKSTILAAFCLENTISIDLFEKLSSNSLK